MEHVKIRFESASALIKEKDDMLWLTQVYSRKRGLGHGTGLMERVTKYAEENKVDLHLLVRPYDAVANKGILTEPQLVEFYSKHGFEVFKQTPPKEMVYYHSQE